MHLLLKGTLLFAFLLAQSAVGIPQKEPPTGVPPTSGSPPVTTISPTSATPPTKPPVTPTSTRPPILPPTPSPTCTCPNPILCCEEVVDSESDIGQKVLFELGVGIKGVHIPVGVRCKEYKPCPAGWSCPPVVCLNPSCCFESSKPSIGAVGCVSVPLYPVPTVTVY